MKKIIQLAILTSVSAQAATVWQTAPNALASASWDTWEYATGPEQTGSGSQGSAQSTSGAIITSSDLTTNVTDAYSFIGGLGSNPDTFYFHDGGATWNGSLELAEEASYVRVSYSLLGGRGGPPSAYSVGPSVEGATVINAGSYGTSKDGIEGVVFFTDLQLGASATKIDASFGDAIFPGFPGSFRSVDGVQICVFNSEPVPEPTSMALALLSASFVLRGKRS